MKNNSGSKHQKINDFELSTFNDYGNNLSNELPMTKKLNESESTTPFEGVDFFQNREEKSKKRNMFTKEDILHSNSGKNKHKTDVIQPLLESQKSICDTKNDGVRNAYI